MGQNKALLPFSSYPTLSQYQLERFSPYFKKVYISCKDKTIFNFQADFIEDYIKDISSPLVGLYSIFSKLDDEYIAVLSVDTPFVDIKIYETLLQYSLYHDIVIPEYHPLCGIYKKTIKPHLKELIYHDKHRFSYLFEKTDTKKIHFKDEKMFYNMNYFDEYEKAFKNLTTKKIWSIINQKRRCYHASWDQRKNS